MKRLAIMVINWNNSEDSIECLESLCAQKNIQCLTLLSIDNASSDNSVGNIRAFAETKSIDIQLIQTGKNGGTAGGFNAGIKWAIEHDYEYIGTLNADAIANEHWASSLVAEIEKNPGSGMATGMLLRRDGKTIDTTGDFYTTWGLPGPRLRDGARELAPTKPGDVFGSTGGGFIAKTAMFKDIGLFDEVFFMYYEDVDMSFRAQLAGYTVRYTPSAIAYHKLGASSKTVPGLAVYNTFKNLPILFIKNVPLGLMPTILPRFTLAYVLILGNAIVHGKGKYTLSGCLKMLILIPHALRERKHIQSSRKVSNEYISSVILHDIPPEQTGLRKFRKFFTGKV